MILNLKWGEFLDDKTLFSFGKTQLRHNKNMNKSKRKQPLASILETTTPSCRNDSNCFSSASTVDANHECLILQYECYMFQTSHTTCHTPFMSIYILRFQKTNFCPSFLRTSFPLYQKKTNGSKSHGDKKNPEKKKHVRLEIDSLAAACSDDICTKPTPEVSNLRGCGCRSEAGSEMLSCMISI